MAKDFFHNEMKEESVYAVCGGVNDEMSTIEMNVKDVLTTPALQKQLHEFKEQHGAEFHLTALGYFGSYAREEARPDSDVDVIFDTTHPNLWTTSILRQDLEDRLGQRVDVIQLHKYMRPSFGRGLNVKQSMSERMLSSVPRRGRMCR